ncbi:MAG TPA: hypothetical protein VGP08_03725 [Pyrinomonadaceae bacterium]|nr:hypothetical protein [Pyrinomonadaceae bacterium]
MIVERIIGNRRVYAECADAHSRMAANVLDVFERLHANAPPLAPGTQVRFGWSLLRLAGDGGGLRVTEPDFVRWPERRWAPTIDTTLSVQAEQVGLLRRLGVDGVDAYFDQAIILARGALARPDIFIRRTPSVSPEDSGWILATLDDPEALTRDENVEGVLIAGLVSRRPSLLQALALPPGFVALFSDEVLVKVFDASGRVLFSMP